MLGICMASVDGIKIDSEYILFVYLIVHYKHVKTDEYTSTPLIVPSSELQCNRPDKLKTNSI